MKSKKEKIEELPETRGRKPSVLLDLCDRLMELEDDEVLTLKAPKDEPDYHRWVRSVRNKLGRSFESGQLGTRASKDARTLTIFWL